MGFYPPDSLVHEAQRRGIRDRPARRQPQPRPLPRRIAARDPSCAAAGGADRARLREGGARGGDGGAGRRARARRRLPRGSPSSPRARGRGWRAWNGWPGRGRWTGSRPRAASERRRGALAGRGRRQRPRRARRAPSWRCRSSRRSRPSWSRSGDWGKLIADYRSTGIALGKHPLELLRPGLDPGLAAQHRPGEDRRRRHGRGRRDGRRPPAPGDREGDRLHAARGRARDRQPDRAAAASTTATAPWSAPRRWSAPAASSSAAKGRSTCWWPRCGRWSGTRRSWTGEPWPGGACRGRGGLRAVRWLRSRPPLPRHPPGQRSVRTTAGSALSPS